MKKSSLSLALFFAVQFLFAQAPQQINYQAVIRDNAGQILTGQKVFLKFTFSQNGMPKSEEIDEVTTTAYGIANTVVGDNAPDFSNIKWGASPVLFQPALSMDGTSFSDIGVAQELNSVPYALFAVEAGHAQLADTASVALTANFAATVADNSITSPKIMDGAILPQDLDTGLLKTILKQQWKEDSMGNIYRDTMRVSIGTGAPVGLLTVKSDELIGSMIHSEYAGNVAVDMVAVSGYSAPQTNYGIGGQFTGGYYGIRAYGAAGGEAAIYASAYGAEKAGEFVGNVSVSGNQTVGGSATVSGKGWFNGEVEANGKGWFNNDVDVDYDIYVGDEVILEGSTNFSLYNSGDQLVIARGGAVYLNTGYGTNINSSRWLIPGDDNNTYLGLSNHRWKEIWCKNGSIETSDARLKTDIQSIPYGLNEVMKMNPVRYHWKAEPRGKPMTGFLAQEMEKIIPEAVVSPSESAKLKDENSGGSTEPDAYGMNYTKLIPVTVRAIQEQQAIIEALQKQVADLQTRLEKLEQH